MVAAIGGIGSANQNVKWGRPAQDPQKAHFEASKAMKEQSQPAQISEHLKRTIELQQSGEKSVHMQALEDRMEKLASGQALSVHMQAIAERVEQAATGEATSIHMQATLAKAEGTPTAYDASGGGNKGQEPGSIIESEG